MEKLTWLASERSMSQEGESEEENSQEENSEPEEEEEEEAEGMEALRKEEEVTGDAVGDAAEKPPSALASPKTTPEVETSITPPGEWSGPLGVQVSLSCIVQRTVSTVCSLQGSWNLQGGVLAPNRLGQCL